ncbi:ATP-binding cassette domain-containing protein [Rhizobium sp. S95]|uniref:ATP-binding cassette domain-containing protein n=1 Tax=Ciceribacter sichuanensis TaxID=2949647 RepID=A0AAJ1BS66_9HYPH|nr:MULTISPECIES: ATP-binding cassette domain-containing protein [unclassified Ciceribacter]MCM2394793.1 ATP-binding cassette domain-containing protein [Ciceribacter sp. S95]MCO5955214.1 ATP-binding cassette domain-containing protein [Ciceribacter sp. S101]
MIEIRDITKSYDGTVVLDRVDLTIPKGGVTSIIGPNGAGKSTLLSIASRLMAPDTGTVTVDGMDVQKTAGDVLARRLSFMRQDNQIAARLTVGDLVAFGRYPYSKGRLTVEDHEHVDRAIGFVALDTFRDRYLDQLSGGQRQRAFVAMVLAQDTDYVLFDEPLNNLDMRHALSTMKLLRRMADDFGKTVVVVLHDINFAATYSDTLVAMHEGRVAAVGTPDEIADPERLRDIFEMDFIVHEIGERRLIDFYV